MQTSAGWYQSLILARPRAVLAILVVALLVMGWQSRHFALDASADALLLEDDEDLQVFRATQSGYRTQDLLVVTFNPGGDLFSDAALDRLAELRDELKQIPSVASIFSLLEVPMLTSSDTGLADMGDNVPTLGTARGRVDRAQAREEVMTSAVFSELIISRDGKTTALLLSLKDDPQLLELFAERQTLRAEARQGQLTESEVARLAAVEAQYDRVKSDFDAARHDDIVAIRAILDRYRPASTLHLGGVPMIADDMIVFIGSDLVTFGAGVLAFIIATLALIFRRWRWVLLPLASCFFAGVVMLGVLGLANWKVTVISSNFISLMLIITMSMNMHLIVRYRQLRADLPDADHVDLIRQTVARMVRPCLYTALTTIIGFSSLVFSGIKPVIDFGWMMSLGLVVTFTTSFLLFPALLAAIGNLADDGRADSPVAVTRALAGFTQRRGQLVLVASAVVAAVSAVGVARLEVENSFINYFRESTEIYRGMRLIDEQLGGTTPLEVLLHLAEPEDVEDEDDECADFSKLTEEEQEECEDLGFGEEPEGDKADYWFTATRVDRIKAVHDYLDSLPEVGKVLSLASVLRVGERINDGKPFTPFELAILYKRIPPDLRASLIDPYVSIERDEARITLRIADSMPELRRDALLKRIHSDLRAKLEVPAEEYTVTGIMVLYNNMLQSLFQSQIQTLGVVMAGIALMFLVLFRSVTLAIIGIVPNVLAAGFVLGLMGLAGVPLDMMTITIAAISIGIAVDNAIHYIYRFREELPLAGGDYEKTLEVCHANIGRAVLYTSITIIFGFSILVFSNFIPTIYFGVLTAVAMFAALIAALTLLPKLILLTRPFKADAAVQSAA
ncbi:MAG: MMPL family transporter [Pseudomonadota bacterium]